MCFELFWANFSYSRENIDWTLIQNGNSERFVETSLNCEIGIRKKFLCLIKFEHIFRIITLWPKEANLAQIDRKCYA